MEDQNTIPVAIPSAGATEWTNAFVALLVAASAPVTITLSAREGWTGACRHELRSPSATSANPREPRNNRIKLLEAREDAPVALQTPEQAHDFVAALVHPAVVPPGSMRVFNGATTGTEPGSSASCRVSLSS